MPNRTPDPLSARAIAARVRRVTRIARGMGFVGRIVYHHLYSQSGGAQFGLSALAEDDLLTIFAEAFHRDADSDEFSLESIIAHKRGHQLLARDKRLARNVPIGWSGVSEEIVASIIGSLLVESDKDQQDLLLKALFEATAQGISPEKATVLVSELQAILREIL